MGLRDKTNENLKYRLILLLPQSRKMLVLDTGNSDCLPSVCIPPGARIARELQNAIRKSWMLDVVILHLLESSDGSPLCAVAEVLSSTMPPSLLAVDIRDRIVVGVDEKLRAQLIAVSNGNSFSGSPFFMIGWIDQAIAWLEAETGKKLSSKSQIEQYNAGGGSSLVRFRMDDASEYWLKATAGLNAHELAVTCILSELAEGYVPKVISTKPTWNAWLMSGEATPIGEFHAGSVQTLGNIVESLARLQLKTVGHDSRLLAAGAFDQSPTVFERHSAALFEFLDEAMHLQASTKVPRLYAARLGAMRMIFDDVTRRMEDLNLPRTIIHGDMNCGNVLVSGEHCRFIDWCEAYVGNPLVTLQHLLLLNTAGNLEGRALSNAFFRARYQSVWLQTLHSKVIDEAYVYMEILAIASSLYGRGDWLTRSARKDPRRLAYARNLARHMDRAASAPELLGALRCRSMTAAGSQPPPGSLRPKFSREGEDLQ